MMRGTYWIPLAVLLVFPTVRSLAQPEEMVDLPSFQTMDEQERLAFVMAGLEMREAELQNFSYSVNCEARNVSQDTGEQVQYLRRDVYEMKRKGGKMLLHLKRFGAEGELQADSFTNWDGSVSRSVTRLPEQTDLRGLITDSESNLFAFARYNTLLGVRMRGGPSSFVTLTELIASAAAEGKQIDVGSIDHNGKQVVRVAIQLSESHYWEFYLDPQRGLMPVGSKRIAGRGGMATLEATRFEKMDGLWVPMKVVFRSRASEDKTFWTEKVYDVTDFARRTVTDQDLEVSHPPGTEVVDTTIGIAYRVLPGGRAEMLPYLDSRTGKTLIPPSKDLDEILASAARADDAYQTKPGPPPASQPTEHTPEAQDSHGDAHGSTTGRFWLGIAVVGVGALLAVLGLRALVARRRRAG